MKTREMTLVWAVGCSLVYMSYLNTCCAAEYTSTAMLRVSWQKPTLLGRAAQAVSRDEFQSYKKTQKLLLKAPFVLRAAISKPEIAKLEFIRSEADPVRWLGRIIKVEFPDDAEIMSVSCTRKDPKEAQLLIKAVVDAYLSEVVNAEMTWEQQRLSELEKLLSEREAELRKKLETLNQLSRTLPPDDAKTATRPVPVDVQMLRLDVDILQRDLQEASMEIEHARIEISAPPRIRLWEPADVPLAPD